MAIAAMQGASFAGDLFTVDIMYDTVSFIIQSIDWQNLTDRDGAVEVDGPSGFSHVYLFPAGSSPTSRDVSGDNLQLVPRTTTDKAGNVIVIAEFPSGWSLQSRWPA